MTDETAVERDPWPGIYRRVRQVVLKRDAHTCKCGRRAVTIVYLPGCRPRQGAVDAPGRLDADRMTAICGACTVLVPADQSGKYGKERRQRNGRRRLKRAA